MDCLDKLLIVRFTEQLIFWKNTIILISGSAIEKDHTALSLLLFSFFTVGHYCDIQACTNHVENMWKNAKISHRALWNAEKSTIIVFARILVEKTI